MPLPEKLKVKLTYVALVNGITKRGINDMELVAKIKNVGNLSKEDEEILRKVCEHYEVDYDRLPGPGG